MAQKSSTQEPKRAMILHEWRLTRLTKSKIRPKTPKHWGSHEKEAFLVAINQLLHKGVPSNEIHSEAVGGLGA